MEKNAPTTEEQINLFLNNLWNMKPLIIEETKDYSMSIFKYENFLAFLVVDKKEESTYYLAVLTLDNFKSLSKYFFLCEDLGEILKSIEIIHDNQKKGIKDYNVLIGKEKICYKTILYTGKVLEFQIMLNKYIKNKDMMIHDLKTQLKYYQRNGEIIQPKDENQKKIREFFDEIRKEINKKEQELFSRNEDFKFNAGLLNSINNLIKNSYYYFDIKFKPNDNFKVENNEIKKIGESSLNCCCVGDSVIPKNIIASYKIKIKNFQNHTGSDFVIGFGKSELSENINLSNMVDLDVGYRAIYYNSNKIMSLNYSNKLKLGDIIEAIMDLNTGTVEFKVNELSVGKIEINKNIDYVPAIMIYSKDDVLELV